MKIALLGRMAFAVALSLLLAPLSASASDVRETLTFHVSTFGSDHPVLITWYDGPTAYSVWSTLSFDGISQIDTLTNTEAGYMVMYWTADHGSWEAYWQGAEDAPDVPPLSPQKGEAATYLRDFVQPYASSQKHAYAALDWMHEYIPANRASLEIKHGERQIAAAESKAREEAIKRMAPQELVLRPIEEQISVLAEKVVEAVDAGDIERAVRLERARKSLVEPIGGNENPTLTKDEWWEEKRTLLETRAQDYRVIETDLLSSLKAEADRRGVLYGRDEASTQRGVLSAFYGDFPLYIASQNTDAADTISVDELWPGGGEMLSLTGAGETLGMWEPGTDAVFTAHLDFQSRTVQADNASKLKDHPTQVAGTIGAGGLLTGMADIRGMAYESNIVAYGTTDVQSELSAEAAAGLQISNHSWGAVMGWELQEYHLDSALKAWYWADPVVEQNGIIFLGIFRGIWNGTYTPNSQSGESTREFDNFASSSNRHLLVWAAGNDRNNVPQSTEAAFVRRPSDGAYIPIPPSARPGPDGDEGGYDTVGPLASSKNSLTVGAVDDILGGYEFPSDVIMSSFSNYGPTDDGRIKPDIVANGVGVKTTSYLLLSPGNPDADATATVSGTSFAAPSVTGALGLVNEHYKDLHPTAEPLLASTLKGLAIHAAHEAGDHPGPDYRFGWGLFNAVGMVDLLEADEAATTDPQIKDKPHLKEVLLKDTDFIQFTVASDGTEPLKVTICWTDPQGNPPPIEDLQVDNPTPMLINDIDLRVFDGSGTAFEPWILDPDLSLQRASARSAAPTTGDDTANNVEQVYLASPAAGTYTIVVDNKGTLHGGEQWVSILISGNSTQPTPNFFPSSIDVYTVPDTAVLEFSGVTVGRYYRLEASQTLVAGSWTTIISDINANKEIMSIPVPFDVAKPDWFFRLVGED